LPFTRACHCWQLEAGMEPQSCGNENRFVAGWLRSQLLQELWQID
jgi:hypothetical protein